MIRTRRNRGHRRGQGANRESVVPHGILEFLDMPALSLLLVLLCELKGSEVLFFAVTLGFSTSGTLVPVHQLCTCLMECKRGTSSD